MRRSILHIIVAVMVILVSCKVTFITGYDQVLDEMISKIKQDFNLHFIKLSRTIQDNDPDNQKFEHFQDYYDNLEADLITLKDRTQFLGPKGDIVKKQVTNVDSIFHAFVSFHKKGIPDRTGDDRHTERDAINTALNSVTVLQEALKTTGKAE